MTEAHINDDVRTPRGRGLKDDRCLATIISPTMRYHNRLDTAALDEVVHIGAAPPDEHDASSARIFSVIAGLEQAALGYRANCDSAQFRLAHFTEQCCLLALVDDELLTASALLEE